MAQTTPLWFILPGSDTASLPRSLGQYWEWQTSTTGLSRWWGQYHWVLQTYLHLREAGVSCELTADLPDEGIAFAHGDSLHRDLPVTAARYVVCLQVDRALPFAYANYHVLHNPVAMLPLYGPHAYIPPWSQLSLIPRHAARGDSFQNIGFFGYPDNLDPVFREPEFQEALESRGLSLRIPAIEEWHDFSDMDALLAVRKRGCNDPFLTKPSLKLYNAWAAGVVAILGYESTYRSEGRPGKDYVEATSTQAVVEALDRLRASPELRKGIVAEGRKAVRAFGDEVTLARWRELIERRIVPRYEAWRRGRERVAWLRTSGRLREGMEWRVSPIAMHPRACLEHLWRRWQCRS